MNKVKLLGLSSLVMLLSACATGPKTTVPDSAGLTAFENNSGGFIVVNFDGTLKCDSSSIQFKQKGEIKASGLRSVRTRKHKSSTPGFMKAKPGKYNVSGGYCSKIGFHPVQFPALKTWFGNVEVNAGEVVYPGTLRAKKVDVKSRFEGMWAVVALGQKVTTTYVTYEFVDNSEDVIERLKPHYPDIAEKLVYRPPMKIISKEEYLAAIDRAYARDETGKYPTIDGAEANFKKEMVTVLLNSLKSLPDRNSKP